ncbi:hypothetical protein ACH5RR_023991 [Cinchona calisaya]|uniref:RNase H type-1 domain-containing protein n=1 Tax=Cinchona calisaya TaxID=153742 RepID=A0ABD2ZDM0_9GENT
MESWIKIVIGMSPTILQQTYEAEEFIIFSVIAMHLIWCQRNKNIYDHEGETIEHVVRLVAKTASAHWQAVEIKPRKAHFSELILEWIPPPPNWVKVNFDTAYESSQAWEGVVCRNSSSTILYSWAGEIKAADANMAEALTGTTTLRLIEQLHMDKVIFEGMLYR